MNSLGYAFIDNAVQCWSCPVFDRLFLVVSQAAAAVYNDFVVICTILFCVIFGFYIFGIVWKNLTGKFADGFKDGWFKNSVWTIIKNSLFALAFLGMGIMVPRFVSMVTFEPVAYLTQTYSVAMLKQTPDHIDAQVSYTPVEITDADSGMFRPQLRDAIIDTAKVTITMFQNYMKLGVAMLDAAFSWPTFFGIGVIIKHFILAIIGLYLFITFFKMFFKFLCYFADVIVAMAMFAFFFPLSLVTASFQDIKDGDMPDWLAWAKKLGKDVGVDQIKNVISAIVSLGAAVITYTVILVILMRFFVDNTGDSFDALLNAINSGQVFEFDLDSSGINDLTIVSIVVLVYVLEFIYDNIPKVTNMILGMFNVTASKNPVGEKLGDSIMQLTKDTFNGGKKLFKMVKKNAE